MGASRMREYDDGVLREERRRIARGARAGAGAGTENVCVRR
jgi:hypothetical protein